MGFKTGKNGLLKRTAKPQLTRKQNNVLKITKKFEASLAALAQTKTILTRRDGQVVQRTIVKADPKEVDPICPVCKGKMELKIPKRGQDWKTFWGCTNFKTGCKGTRKYSEE